MRQRIDTGNGERKIGIILVSQAEPEGFDSQAKLFGISIKRNALGGCLKQADLFRVQDRIVGLSGRQPFSKDSHRGTQWEHRKNLDRFGKQRPSNNAVGFQLVWLHTRAPACRVVSKRKRARERLFSQSVFLFEPHRDGSSRVSFREATSDGAAESKEVPLWIAPAGSTGLRPLTETNLWRKRVVMAL